MLSIVVLFNSACQDDFLETIDQGAISPDNFPETTGHMDLLLNAIYANTHSQGLYGMDLLMYIIYSLENTHNMGWKSDQFRNTLIIKEANAGNGYLAETWRDVWRGIQQSNTYLANVEKISASLSNNERAAFNQG
ncbi:MAG: hypothetical protein HC880_05330 [Bacteroidia bacterium]|nr:hypothetical protein [Bacteroidia bacterium]